MKPEAHGGDRLRMAALAGRAPDSLLDFSVNVRPEGAPEFLRLALCRALDHISAYPSPHAEEAMEAAARVYGLPADCFVFGNGTNELIHLLARVLKEDGTPCAAVIEPAFSEYALACGLAGLEVRHPDCGVRRDGDSDEDMLRQLLSLLADVPARQPSGWPIRATLPDLSCRLPPAAVCWRPAPTCSGSSTKPLPPMRAPTTSLPSSRSCRTMPCCCAP